MKRGLSYLVFLFLGCSRDWAGTKATGQSTNVSRHNGPEDDHCHQLSKPQEHRHRIPGIAAPASCERSGKG